MSCEAMMQFIGEAKGKKFYFAGNGFINPGIYYFDEATQKNINVIDELAKLAAVGDVIIVCEGALKAFAPGTDILPWGRIKALIGVDNAKKLTRHNYDAEQALAAIKSWKDK